MDEVKDKDKDEDEDVVKGKGKEEKVKEKEGEGEGEGEEEFNFDSFETLHALNRLDKYFALDNLGAFEGGETDVLDYSSFMLVRSQCSFMEKIYTNMLTSTITTT